MDDSIRPRKPTDPPPTQEGAGPQLDKALVRLVHEMTDFDAVAADLAYNRLKNTGGLQRAEADRALRLQIERQGNYTNTGLWA